MYLCIEKPFPCHNVAFADRFYNVFPPVVFDWHGLCKKEVVLNYQPLNY